MSIFFPAGEASPGATTGCPVQNPADLAWIHVDPGGNADTFAGKGPEPRPTFLSRSCQDHFGCPFEKAVSQVVRLAGAKGIRRVFGTGPGNPIGPLLPEKQGLRQAGETGSRRSKAQPQVVVFCPPRRTVTSHRLDNVFPEHDARMDEGGFHEEVTDDLVVGDQRILPGFVRQHPAPDPMPGKMPEAAGNQPHRRLRLHICGLQLQPPRVADVVGIQTGYQ